MKKPMSGAEAELAKRFGFTAHQLNLLQRGRHGPIVPQTALERAERAFAALGYIGRCATVMMWARGPYCPAFLNLQTEWLLYAWETREARRFPDVWSQHGLVERRKAMRAAIRSWRRLRARGEIPKEFLR